jgi:hypothetical protein
LVFYVINCGACAEFVEAENCRAQRAWLVNSALRMLCNSFNICYFQASRTKANFRLIWLFCPFKYNIGVKKF